ncbi:MAG TPA: ATPase [Cytophagales bacterium]|nr:ATPase [Cytophagales bacterium]HAA21674.1 ATPase [Cytophagales bacterium]HAP63732.1 ATPase [Cytophagales bacterium]
MHYLSKTTYYSTALRFCLLLLFVGRSLISYAQVEGPQGLWDVREVLSQKERVSLQGDWEFYWQQLLMPGQPTPDSVEYRSFPGLWTDLTTPDGESLPSFSYASYRLRLVLDPTQEYALYTPAVYNAFRVYVNGKLVSQNGVVGPDAASSQPFWYPVTVPLDQVTITDTTEIILQVSNFVHFRGGTVDALVLGKRESLLRWYDLLVLFDMMLTGALIMGGLFFLGLYLFGRHQASILYFSLFCLVFSYYIIGSGNYVLHGLLPWYPWWLAIRVEYFAIYLTTILIVKYTQSLYPHDTPKLGVRLIILIAWVYMGFVVILPTTVFPMLHSYYLVFLMVVILAGVGIYIRAAIFRRIGYVYSLTSIIILLTALMLRVIDHLIGFNLPEYIVPIGYMIFFFLQSLTLSQQFASAWKMARDQAEAALQSRSNFLSVMSHEIRTPMNAVIGLTNHLIQDDPPFKQHEVLNTLKFSAENLLMLINDVLDFSKLEAEKVAFDRQAVALKPLLKNLIQVYSPLAEEKGVDLILEYDEQTPPQIVADSTRTAQVLTNLIGNAIKFTEKGQVTLQVEVKGLTETEVTLHFSVIDTGIGIAPEKLETIFDSFSQANTSITREYGGTGLGLSITKRLLNLQGVQLKVDSEVGKGSRFHFRQAFAIVRANPAEVEKEMPKQVNLRGNVLLVEDNEVNVLVANKFLQRWGLDVTVATNGQEALDRLEEQGFDLVLMDLQMPVMDGYTATEQIRLTQTMLPIIALTATALPNERQRIFDVGMNDFVLKPFKPETLYAALSKYLNGKEQNELMD